RIRLERWGPRTLDLDLLLYDNENIDIPRLKVPHYGMKTRSFVLVPLAAIAPDLILPCNTAIDSLIDTKMLAELQQLGIDH
ncbi:MAG: 2-amino-4-hydroxy-6-hydroxymethyldihydropteridine diphosphokinase, partial [Shewanella oncorhynchi]